MKAQSGQNMVVGSLALSVLLASAGTSMANLALPSISAEFTISFSTVRWVVLCYLLAITFSSLVVGMLGDLKGRRKILLAGTALFTAGTLVSAFSFSFSVLIFARVAQGMGAAALAVLPIAVVTDTLPRERMGRAIGLLATMSAIGTATGPSIGGFLLEAFGWRAVFVLMTILGFLAFYSLFRFVQPREGSGSIDRQNAGFMDFVNSIYSDSSLRTQLFSNLTISAVMISTLIVGPFYLTHALHLNSVRMGLVMSAGPMTSILSGTLAGYAVDRLGSQFVIKFGFVQLLIGTISFVLLPTQFGSVGFALSAVLLSLGYQLFLSANSNSFMKNTRADRQGMAAGALNLSRNLGLICGTYVMGGIFDVFARQPSPSYVDPGTISNGLQMTFSIASILIAFLLINNLRNQQKSTYGKGFVNEVY